MTFPQPTDARPWLRMLEASYLSPPAQILIDEINHSLDARDYEHSQQLVDRLLGMRASFSSRKEKAETTLECALVSYQMGNYREAIDALEEARQLYRNNRHYMAIALWMAGCIQWILPEEHDKAYSAWSRCISEFDVLQKSSGNAIHAQWYYDHVQEIKADIALALKQERLPDFGDRQGQSTGPDLQDFPEPLLAPESGQENQQTMLQLFRVVDEIPAQGFGPGGFRLYTIGEVDINQVIIQGRPFRMVNVHDQNKVISLRSGSYVVLKVLDDNMDAPGENGEEGIDTGDFVLIHLQDSANDGDIIATRLGKSQSQVSLARLRIIQDDRQYLVEPHSKNPDRKSNTFNHLNEGFKIFGIVLVVFKPITK